MKKKLKEKQKNNFKVEREKEAGKVLEGGKCQETGFRLVNGYRVFLNFHHYRLHEQTLVEFT